MDAVLKKLPQCATTFGNIEIVIDEGSQVCYGSPTGRPIGINKIDAGSPLIALSSIGEASCLIGIASSAESSFEDPRFPRVFARADALHLWINTQRLLLRSQRKSSCSLL